jgi:hypothetical protein
MLKKMKEIVNCTTLEQEKRLVALGIKPDTADFYRIPMVGGYRITSEWTVNAMPCWSLAGLLNLMPKTITDNDGIVYDRRITGDTVDYYCIDYDVFLEPYFDGGTLFENMLDCIEMLVKKKYVNEDYRNQ